MIYIFLANLLLTAVNLWILMVVRDHVRSIHTKTTENGEISDRIRTLEEGQLRMNQELARIGPSINNIHNRIDQGLDELGAALRDRKSW